MRAHRSNVKICGRAPLEVLSETVPYLCHLDCVAPGGDHVVLAEAEEQLGGQHAVGHVVHPTENIVEQDQATKVVSAHGVPPCGHAVLSRHAARRDLARSEEFLRKLSAEADSKTKTDIRALRPSSYQTHLDTVSKALTDMLTQYLMHNPEGLRIPNVPVLAYILVNGGIFMVVRHLSDPNPPMTYEELARTLADSVGGYVKHELKKQGGSRQ